MSLRATTWERTPAGPSRSPRPVHIASIPCGPTTPTTGVVIYGNFIGTNAAGTGAVGNGSGGISLGCGASNTSVGATSAGAGNVISGNSSVASSAPGIGVSSTASGNVIQGNLIGTNPSGTAALPNFLGIDLEGAVGVTVGGTSAAARNVISGNSNTGVRISSGSNHTVQGNFIGTDATGASALGNNNQGLRIDNSTGNVVGGSAAGAGNVISANSDVAVRITTASNNTIQKNVIGLNAAGSALLGNLGGGVYVFGGTGNRITANSIDGNTNLGIDLGGDGVTPNDPCDPDAGSNNLQNYPVLTSVSSGGGSTTIQGTLNSTANTSFTVEFFSSPACDPSGFGEGRVYLGSAVVATDGTCSATFNTTLPVSINTGDRVTATATDPAGNTSEFSACSPTPGQYFTVAPCRVADTRNLIGPYGGPALAANADRTFVIATQCGIPSSATAVAFNFTVTQPTALGDLRVIPAGVGLPLVSVMNWRPGQTRANNAVVSLGPAGDIVAHVDQGSGTVHFIIDVNGYFQ